MGLLDEINKLREELHGLIAGNPELKRQQVIECSERLDKLIYDYLLLQSTSTLEGDLKGESPP